MCDVNTKEKTNGTRLRRLLLDGGTQTLRQLFDSIHPKGALPGVFKTHEVLLRRKCHFDDQKELLFPPSGGQPDSKDFDITLLILLLTNICTSLKEPTTGWSSEPSSSDQSKEANIVRIRLFRNKIQHLPSSEISDDQFEKLWNELSEVLKALGLPDEEINNLKDKPIDDIPGIQERWEKWCDHEQRIHKLEEKVGEQGARIKKIEEQLQDKRETTKLMSCIPDNPSRFIGREKELKEIINAKTKDEQPFVFLYGMAGIGKSTLIKKASWDLVHKHDKTVYYIDLCHCKATEKDISKTINYKLFQGTKVENEPREALNIWARNLDQNVILVLDNAEDVLTTHQTGNDDKSDFVTILLEVREFSAQKVDYLIASREALTFDAVDVSKKEMNLTPFEKIESLKFIDLNLKNLDKDSPKLTDAQKHELVKLCCNIPLALQIVIPMLEDYSPDELIERLKSKRSMEDILEPLKQALSLSFDKLDDTQRDDFLMLTIFSGSFTADSAMAILGVDKKDIAVKILKELHRRSLLQRENRKYSFHPFIHKFVVDYGETEANLKQRLLEAGKLSFLSHYECLLLQNTEMFWTKDSYEKALSAFVEDRANFEKALEMLLLVPDPVDLTKATMENTKMVVDKLTGVVMYLESCTSWDLLGRLLDKFIALAKDNNLSSRELESLCWKGHFERRLGDDGEYEKLLEKADKLYDSVPDIDDNAELCYQSAKGRYLGHKQKNEEAAKMFEEIIKFCKDKVDKNPSLNEDYARAIVELGYNLKHKGELQNAVEKYKQASSIYEEYLGQHIKTALSYKDIADGYLKQDTPDENLQALTYYNKAIDMLTMLKSDSETHMILLLKNTGICYRSFEKYEESEDKFKKALSIAESKLKENHRYKCLVKEELAYLYDDMKEKEKARSVAEEAIIMAKKLKLNPADCFKDEPRLQIILSSP